ncbi:MAG: entericidin, EcnA/B family [Silicimonas sp.]|nr:entericidin, EcnA/B family [Silicimonas sp.]NNF89745.1 entericidin EcnA/B family protein [Boseongicola sp.]RZW05422.1 MAG: entericidin EcnA/B family protein [Paracoccaceae bacterium]MBT8424934.1 entericidin, EcnA/B family [Silicimonas sp.]NND20332.1 entericidin EcnA/B family protein [Silicimonas sp.]
MKKLAILAALLTALSACNTIEGFGADVSAGARAVDRAI